MKRILFIFLFSVCYTYSQDYTPVSQGEVINHNYYTLSYLEEHEQAEWVHYRLTYAMINGSAQRKDNFRSDYSVSTGSASVNDYYKSGFDRGHLAPAADMKINDNAMSESFLMSNISPQNASFNRGGWKILESLIRSWVGNKTLYVTTGGILNEPFLLKIGVNNVSVPDKYYKIVFDSDTQSVVAFVMPNSRIDKNLKDYVVSVDYIENITGIDFLSELDDKLENQIESSVDLSKWDFSKKQFNNSSQSSKTSSNITSNQCKGIAKSTKSRCRNKTKNENGYCYAHQNQSSDYKPKPKVNYVGRCNATTKSGTRCKRNAASGRRYCWQH